MKQVNVGLLGSVINNGNMGCVALTYSLIHMLEKIGDTLGVSFNYYILEGEVCEENTHQLCEKLSISPERMYALRVTTLHRFRSMIHHPLVTLKAICCMKNCNFFIDLTAGDSFSDLYGQWRFDETTHIKEIVYWLKKPLILGPQTYGPFDGVKNQNRAKKVIGRSCCVIARDQLSADYLAGFMDKKVYVTTDLAFGLPYEQGNLQDTGKIKIGINVSSLLVKKEREMERDFHLKTDYGLFIQEIMEYLVQDDKYEIHVIPHVGKDAGDQFRDKFPKVNYLPAFSNPIDAKSYIAQMDVFIGARMHATIGAFSSGVATIPIAYSRKFNGLYENLNYPYVVDLLSLPTEDAVKKTLSYIEKYRILKDKVQGGRVIVQEKLEQTQEILSECISAILSIDERMG